MSRAKPVETGARYPAHPRGCRNRAAALAVVVHVGAERTGPARPARVAARRYPACHEQHLEHHVDPRCHGGARRTRERSRRRPLALASTVAKNDALLAAADLLVARRPTSSPRTTSTWPPARQSGTHRPRSTACASRRRSRGHGRRAAPGGGARRSGRRDHRGLRPAQRPARREGARAARRGCDHLREPAQRHERRRRAVHQGGQRRVPAGLVGRDRVQPGDRGGAARRAGQGRPARGRASCSSKTPATRPPSSSCGARGRRLS